MCGIAGIMTIDGGPPEGAVLDRLLAALEHRGPDGHGRHQSGGVAMVQTRLAIIDLDTGGQPFYAADGSKGGEPVALVANGEIYNYVELRARMTGVRFSTNSDCEPPLHLYLKHGLDFTGHLRGMYALAIHHPAEKRLVLARDPFGIKPLYYAETPMGFAFASEPQALIRAGLVQARLVPGVRDELLQLQFTTGRQTIFAGIQRVLPGETLVVEGGRISGRRRINPLPEEGPRETSEPEALLHLDDLLNDAVGIHQRSDVPYGMFLSGGIDSSVLLAMMDRLNEKPVRAFTVGFPGTNAMDERQHARMLARRTGAYHVEVEFGAEDFWALLPEIAAAVDDPAADYAVLPTYKLAAAVRKEGLKVVLSGEGGDEMFGGYGRYRAAMRPWPLTRALRRRGILNGLPGHLEVLREPASDGRGDWRKGLAVTEATSATGGRTRLQAAQALDCADWLPNDLLTKVDRCLMAHGVEGRVPFLDGRLAAFAHTLPDRLKVRRRRRAGVGRSLGKWLLRRWLETGLPSSRPFSPKRGFTVPVGQWMGERGRQLGSLVAAQPGVAEVCLPRQVEALFNATNDARAAKAAWTLLFHALWHRTHIQGLAPEGGILETLSAS